MWLVEEIQPSFMDTYGSYVFLGIFLVAMIFLALKIQKAGYTDKKVRQAQRNKKLIRAYVFLESFPLTTRMIRSISNKLHAMSVLTQQEVYIETVKIFGKGAGLELLATVGGILMFDDAISMQICIVFGLVMASVLVTKTTDKIYQMVLEALRIYVGSLNEEYLRLGNVAEAMQEAECPEILKSTIDNILNIMTSSNSEIRLREFFEKTPFRQLQTLARVCYNVNNSGDTTVGEGQSSFMKSLEYMSEDLNSDLEKIDYRKRIFGKIEYLCVFPIPAIKLCELGFQSIIPGMAVVYKGMMGYIIKLVILLSGIIGYTVITKINTQVPIKEDDRNYFILELLKNRGFNNFIGGLTCKNKRRRILESKLKNALSKKTPYELYATKFLLAFGIFIMGILTTVLLVQISYENAVENTTVLSMVASDDTKDYSQEFLMDMDEQYFKLLERQPHPEGVSPTTVISNEESMEFARGYLTKLNDLQLQDQVDRMNKKYDQIQNSYYKWYYVLIAFGLAIIGWFIPNLILAVRQWLIKTEAQEDFLQMQTLMAIISSTDADNIEALEQLCQVSKIHKSILLYCYHSYPSDPHRELARLASRTTLPEFKRFVKKMELAVDDIDLQEAFVDLELEREYILKMRDTAIRVSIDAKRGFCGMLSRVPMIALFVGMLVIPLLMVGVNEFTKALGSLSSL